MSQPGQTVFKCPNCGGTLSFEQMKGTNCPFCQAVLPHHGRAAEHAALVNNMLAQQMQASNPWLAGQGPVQISSQYGAAPPPVAQQTMQAVNTHVKRTMWIVLASVGFVTVLSIVIFFVVFFVAVR